MSNESLTQMNCLTDVFGQICDYESLYNAYLKARENKRYRDDVLKFSDRLEENLTELQNELMWETYKVGRYRSFFVYEPKTRLIMASPFRDRVVQWSVYSHLNPFYDKQFIEDSYACRKDKGSHAAANRLQYWLRQVSRKPGEWYYLKLDISKFFYRVDHAILLEILGQRVKDERVIRLLDTIINSEDAAFGLPAGIAPEDCPWEEWLYEVGVPIGNLTSPLFANVYLNEIDQHCKHQRHLHYYIRYMDDIVILHNDKRALHQIKDEIEALLWEKLRLNLNRKTAIRPVSLGVDFVGYHIWATHRKLKKSTARRILRHFKGLCGELKNGEISRPKFDRAVAAYTGVLEHCNSHGLKTKLNEIYCTYFPKSINTNQ